MAASGPIQPCGSAHWPRMKCPNGKCYQPFLEIRQPVKPTVANAVANAEEIAFKDPRIQAAVVEAAKTIKDEVDARILEEIAKSAKKPKKSADRHKDKEARRVYQRDLMRKRRAAAKAEKKP